MLIDDFNNTIDIWIDALKQYDFNTLCTKPGTESWSLGQVYMHLLNETGYYLEQIASCLGNNENSGEEMVAFAKELFIRNGFPDEMIKGDPVFAEKIMQPISKQQLQQEMQNLKLEMNAIWTRIIHSRMNGKTQHPGQGYFNPKEWFQYAEMHLRHHLRQKRRIEQVLKIMA